MLRWCLLLLIALSVSTEARTKKTLWFVSWNVADNKNMGGGIDDSSVRHLLGLDISQKTFYDMYAISLQENCFACNENNIPKIAQLFLNALHRASHFHYELVGHSATRLSSTCESFSCSAGQHGTTVMFVLARKGQASAVSSFHTNKCNAAFIKNSEKGIAALKFQLREAGGPTVCVGGLHLDSESPAERRQCFKSFMEENRKEMQACQIIFFAGDYNTRTGDKGGSKVSRTLTIQEVHALKPKDEMVGQKPYGGKRLIDYISQVTGKRFSEAALKFSPTYSLKPASECRGKIPCYRGDRPPSWTDRIVFSGSTSGSYFSLRLDKSDHFPVAGVFYI